MTAPVGQDTIGIAVDDGFAHWMSQFAGFLAITTYQAGKVVLVGWDGSRVTVLPRTFEKPMGIAWLPSRVGQPMRLALATRQGITLFADAPLLAPDFFPDRRTVYDALFLPRTTYHTGDLNVHDIAFGDEGLWLVNTRFSCLSRLSESFSFVPSWKPPFVSEFVPEDRCHLNGLCLVQGKPAYVTAFGATDTVGGWRPNKTSGGVVVDAVRNEVLVRELCMPHSPRWHDGQLWILNSGTGELLRIDPRSGEQSVVAALPGYLRGLSFAGSHALVGLCQVREKRVFDVPPVAEREPRLLCGVAIVDLRTGQRVGLFEFTSGATEVFEMLAIPGPRRSSILSSDREEARQAFPAPGFSYWLRKENEIPPS